MSVFSLEGVGFRYGGASRPALEGVDMLVERGGFHSILGPNGSGKSTLLRVMLGELAASAGSVEYGDRSVSAWRRRDIAREIAFVPQSEPLAFPMSVRALVEMGRFPHTGVLGRSGPEGRSAIESAMVRAGIEELADRSVRTLSGGELQRARIARALAQEPHTLVLDEPTASLDLRFEMETFELMRELTATRGLTVVMATHNLNLAARYSSELMLLSTGRVVAAGPPEAVVCSEVIERVYGWPVLVTSHPEEGPDHGAPQVMPLSAHGRSVDATEV